MRLILFLAVLSTVGCANPVGRILTDSAAGASGGFLGSELSNGNPAYTALGTAAGIGVAEGVRGRKLWRERKDAEAAKQSLRGQATKEEYFWQQSQHRPQVSPTLQVPIPLPERVTKDGVRLEPTTEWIEIHQ